MVGSGPAGMAVAADLNRAGHSVIVYERDEAPGGLNRFGVPDAKLPKEVIDRRIALMEAEGIEFRCGVDVGGEIDPAALLAEVDALVIATGARLARRLDVPGADLPGVLPAMTYLYARNRAVAAGRTAGPRRADRRRQARGRDRRRRHRRRLHEQRPARGGAHRHPARQLPGAARHPPARHRRLAGGAAPAADPLRARRGRRAPLGGHGHRDRRARRARRRRRGGPRRRDRPTAPRCPAARLFLPADLVLVAIGFSGPEPTLPDQLGLSRGPETTIDGHTTNVPGVFVAGDARMGARLTVTAIDDGRRCAPGRRALAGDPGVKLIPPRSGG